MATRDSWSEFFAGLFVGAAMGCTTILLFTPKSGRQVRDSLAKEARRLAAKAYKSCGDLNELKDVIANETAENLVNNIQSIRSAGL